MRRLTICFVVLGTALRLLQYTAGGGQWLDEIAVSRNILERSLWELLTQPLAYDQSAPRGFLLVQKLAVTLLGPSDAALRLFPFVSSVVSLLVFWRLCERVLIGVGTTVAVALMATAGPLVVYSGQVKQYSTDVAVAMILFVVSLDLLERGTSPHRTLWAALAGGLGVWFSQPAVLLLGALGLVLLLRRGREADGRGQLFGLLAVWGVSAALATLAGLASVTPATKVYLHLFWARSFPPPSIQEALASLWPLSSLARLLGSGGQASLNYPLVWLYVGLVFVGWWDLWRRRPAAAALLVTPVILGVIAAITRQYPFGDRVLLYLLPVFLLGIADAAEWLHNAAAPRLGVWAALPAVALTAGGLLPMAKMPPPYSVEDVRPALAYLAKKRQPGDRIYVYYGAVVGFTYYADRHGLQPADYTVGGCHRGDSRRYLEELDTLRGERRVWYVLTHAIGYNEREDIGGYLNAIAVERPEERFVSPTRIITFPAFPPVDVFLYDFSDPARLAAAASATYKITGPNKAHPAYGCAHGPQSMIVPTAGRTVSR